MARYDRLRLKKWSVQVAIGAWEHELATTQELILDVRLKGNWATAAASDRLEDAVDYAEFRGNVESWLMGRRWVLLETFTSDLCQQALSVRGVLAVKVRVAKPAAQAPVEVSCTMSRKK